MDIEFGPLQGSTTHDDSARRPSQLTTADGLGAEKLPKRPTADGGESVESSAVDEAAGYAETLLTLAAQEAAAVSALTAANNERARAARAAAAAAAAETTSDEVVRTAAAVCRRVAESAHRVAKSHAEAVAFASASVPPGDEASAARTAARLASAVTTEAMMVAEEVGVSAAVIAEAAADAAAEMAATTADEEMAIELEERRAAEDVRLLVGQTARRVAHDAISRDHDAI